MLSPRLILLAALLALPQDPASSTNHRRPLSLLNGTKNPIPKGTLTWGPLPESVTAVDLYFEGKRIPSWSSDGGFRFRTAADIPDFEIDRRYEIRYGGKTQPFTAEDVYDLYEDFREKPVDEKRVFVDPALRAKTDHQGLGITWLPKRSRFEPASVILLKPLPQDFSLLIELRWELYENAAFSMSARVEVEPEAPLKPEWKERCSSALQALKSDDFETRDQASARLVKLGNRALGPLTETIRASEGEVRARAEQAYDAIVKADPPPEIRDGFTASAKGPISLHTPLARGRLVPELKRTDRRDILGCRTAAGVTDFLWNCGWTSRTVPVEGKVKRLRFDFWSDEGGEIGAVWITNVLVTRSSAWSPRVELGEEDVTATDK